MVLTCSSAGYPIISHFTENDDHVITSSANSLNLVTNTTGQIPSMQGKWTMIDNDTPPDAYTLDSYTEQGKQLQLVFSDEFNQDGRTFYPGDDPFWEALDLHCAFSALSSRNGTLNAAFRLADGGLGVV